MAIIYIVVQFKFGALARGAKPILIGERQESNAQSLK
jgi:hypothetical protein